MSAPLGIPSCFSRSFDCVLFVDSKELQANNITKTEFNVTQSIGCASCEARLPYYKQG